MTAPINALNMDDFHAEQIDGYEDPWGPSSRESAKVFRTERVAASHPEPVRHRRGNTLRGFIGNPTIMLAEIAVVVAASFVLGFMAGGAA